MLFLLILNTSDKTIFYILGCLSILCYGISFGLALLSPHANVQPNDEIQISDY